MDRGAHITQKNTSVRIGALKAHSKEVAKESHERAFEKGLICFDGET